MIEEYLMFFGNQDIWSTVLWFLMFGGLMIFYPKIMISQTVLKLEKDVIELEGYVNDSKKSLFKIIPNSTKVKLKVNTFLDFFIVSPISLDPFGIVKKLEHVIRQGNDRFDYFVKEIAPRASDVQRANIKAGISDTMMIHQITKIIRHYMETIKKYKLLQLAMVLQMQIPMIKDVAKAANSGTKAFVGGIPIGDSIGPMVAASLIKKKPKVFKEEEIVVSKEKMLGRNVYVVKALGPGATTGYPGRFLNNFVKRNRIKKIITIDAGLRLQGEKVGSVCEGVGIAMGGVGVERYNIEKVVVEKKLPIDAVVIKVDEREVFEPMKKEIADSVDEAVEAVKASLRRSKSSDKVMIMGVGNTCGVGNTRNTISDSIKKLKPEWKKNKGKKKKKGFFK